MRRRKFRRKNKFNKISGINTKGVLIVGFGLLIAYYIFKSPWYFGIVHIGFGFPPFIFWGVIGLICFWIYNSFD